METGLTRTRKRRIWLALGVVRRNAAAIAAGVLLAAIPAGVAAAISTGEGWHSWQQVGTPISRSQPYPPVADLQPVGDSRPTGGVTIAAAGLTGLVATLGLLLLLMVVSFAAFACWGTWWT